MSHKAKAPTLPSKKRAKRRPAKRAYRSLANGPAPAERLAKFLKETETAATRPMTEGELDQWLSEHAGVWPDETEIDEFVAWLHKARREGRYA
jgi:hypothetical protein